MLNRDLGSNPRRLAFDWDDLKESAPTVMGLAQICYHAMIEPPECEFDSLTDEAKILLFCAKKRGVMELKGDWQAFDSSQRLLAVSVEVEDQAHWLFKRLGDPHQTMRFLEGFTQLCRNHLVIHQWQREFCLTDRGFAMAAKIEGSPGEGSPVDDGQVEGGRFAELLEFPQKTDHGSWSNG